MKKIKVLMIAPTPFFAERGCHSQIYEEIKALKKLGCEIVICTYHIGRDVPDIKIYRSLNIPWYNKLSAGPSLHKIYIDFLLFIKTLAVARKFKPDIIHGHLHEGALIGWGLKLFVRKPLLFDLQGSLSKEIAAYKQKKPLSFSLFESIERRINKLPDVIVTQSTEMINDLKNRFKIKKNKLVLTFDGADVETFQPGLDVSNLKKELALHDNKKIIVYLGGLTTNKGVDNIINAIPHVIKKDNNVLFLIMGYPNEEHYKKMAQKLGVSEYTLFTGKIDYSKAHLYLNLGNLALSPKDIDTEGNAKLYNYMACGLPVVAFDTKTDREVLGDYGVYAKRKDIKDYADKILFLLSDANERERLGMGLRNRVVDKYSWDKVGERIFGVYTKLNMYSQLNNNQYKSPSKKQSLELIK